ncbi:surfeit locus protein 1-like [Dendronephthya gigantea]|uniref:surfeit locus protein 1-like n=1 Tax=Dendronephthya gigantea TaxID=151771 RepID=UPI00106D369D|nr:surfeit locus protein 1-like [Dendronephthya gigantea]
MAIYSLRRWSYAFSRCKMVFKFSTRSASMTSKNRAPLLLTAMPVISFGLGTWQVYRLQWKKSLIKQLEDRTMREPLEITDSLELLKDEKMQYRRVKIRGTFDHSKELHIFPRSQNNDGRSGIRGPNATGAQIVTPFRLSSGEIILVNRGWVEKSKKNPVTRPEGQVVGEVELIAFIRLGQKRPQFVPKNDVEKNHWHYCDLDQMAEVTQSLPILVDADAGSTFPGGPIGGQTRVYLRNEHLQYIFTWYGLSFATALMLYKFRKSGKWR